MLVNGFNPNGNLRINKGVSQPRTSSNQTFQEKFRAGMKNGIDLTNSALRQVTKPIPGSAALSATLSDAAKNLGGSSRLDGGTAGLATATADGDMGALQDAMARKNEDLLAQQMRVSMETTTYTTQSNILKAYFDASRAIGSNIR